MEQENRDDLTAFEDELLVQALMEYEQKADGHYEKKNTPITQGLVNFNNTCFISASIIPCLNQIGMRNLLLDILCKNLDELNAVKNMKFLKGITKIFLSFLGFGTDETLKEHVRRLVSRVFLDLPQFQAGHQADAHEFFNAMLDLIERDIGMIAANQLRFLIHFNHIWTLKVREKFVCDNHHVNERIEESRGLLVQISSFDTLEGALTAHFQIASTSNGETIGCGPCKDANTGVRYREIINSPPTLVLYIKRFYTRPAQVRDCF